jgi:hypothetical protein
MNWKRHRIYELTGIALAALLTIGIAGYYSGYMVRMLPMPTGQAQDSSSVQDSSVVAMDFRVLSQAHTDVCAYIGDQPANTNYVNSLADNYYLQGSCCSPMDYTHYASQITSLKNYSNIPIIPRDPYNVSASQVKQLISYAGLTMTSAQQAVYDDAAKMSGEGPCCCQCWAWYAHEGMAKTLISQQGWNAKQVANMWSLEDCCGGA